MAAKRIGIMKFQEKNIFQNYAKQTICKKQISALLTPEQAKLVKKNGGSKWLRRLIDDATIKTHQVDDL
jgi:hypothetical protein